MLNRKNINKKFGLILSILSLAVFVQGSDDCGNDEISSLVEGGGAVAVGVVVAANKIGECSNEDNVRTNTGWYELCCGKDGLVNNTEISESQISNIENACADYNEDKDKDGVTFAEGDCNDSDARVLRTAYVDSDGDKYTVAICVGNDTVAGETAKSEPADCDDYTEHVKPGAPITRACYDDGATDCDCNGVDDFIGVCALTYDGDVGGCTCIDGAGVLSPCDGAKFRAACCKVNNQNPNFNGGYNNCGCAPFEDGDVNSRLWVSYFGMMEYKNVAELPGDSYSSIQFEHNGMYQQTMDKAVRSACSIATTDCRTAKPIPAGN